MKLLNLEKDYSIKLSSKIVDYIYPDYIFIPMYEDYKLIVKNKEEVKKEQVLLSNSEGHYFYSPISGTVVGAKECILSNGKKEKCLVIENDFKEKMVSRTTMRKNLLNIPKTEFLNTLKNKAIISNKTKRLLFDLFNKRQFSKILVAAFETEPYLASTIFKLNAYTSEILETISFLARIFKTEENTIVLKNNDRDNVESYTNILGTYPEIGVNVIPDLYPIHLDDVLLKYVGFNKEETLIIGVDDLLTIYTIMKKNKLVTERLITITGNAIENPIVVKAKIGTNIKSIIDEHIKYLSNDEVIYIVNGLMCGKEVLIDDLILTFDLDGIIINYKKEFLEHECIKCGKCREVCPAYIDPRLTFYNCKDKKNRDKCINCGLCTYVCPAYINFKKRIEEIKNEE